MAATTIFARGETRMKFGRNKVAEFHLTRVEFQLCRNFHSTIVVVETRIHLFSAIMQPTDGLGSLLLPLFS